MTIAGTTIQTSGSTGNGATTQFNFSFHLDPDGYGATTAASQVQVVRETISSGVETTLTLTTDYSVTINADQSTSPGGYITMVTAPSSAYKIWIRLNPDFTQKTDMQAQGAFNAEVVEDEFDQLTRKALWLKDAMRRAPRVGVQAGTSFDGEITGDLTAGYTAVIKNDLSGWQLGAAASATVSAAMASFVNSASLQAARRLLGGPRFHIFDYITDTTTQAAILAFTQTADVAAEIQTACNAADDVGGVVVFPPGRYPILSSISTNNVGFQGEGAFVEDLYPYGTKGVVFVFTSTTNTPFKLGASVAFDNIVFWWPNQIDDRATWVANSNGPIVYPPLIENTDTSTVMSGFSMTNCVVINAYDFIDVGGDTAFDKGGRWTFSNNRICALRRTFNLNNIPDVIQIDAANIFGWNVYADEMMHYSGAGAGATISVSSITRSGGTATVTTASAHGYATGKKVTIAGATQSDYNGEYVITSTGATTFTYTVGGAPATPATGTITATAFYLRDWVTDNSTFLRIWGNGSVSGRSTYSVDGFSLLGAFLWGFTTVVDVDAGTASNLLFKGVNIDGCQQVYKVQNYGAGASVEFDLCPGSFLYKFNYATTATPAAFSIATPASSGGLAVTDLMIRGSISFAGGTIISATGQYVRSIDVDLSVGYIAKDVTTAGTYYMADINCQSAAVVIRGMYNAGAASSGGVNRTGIRIVDALMAQVVGAQFNYCDAPIDITDTAGAYVVSGCESLNTGGTYSLNSATANIVAIGNYFDKRNYSIEPLGVQRTASGVNGIDIIPATTGNGPRVRAVGADAAANLVLEPKGGASVISIGAHLPSADATYALGTDSQQWSQVRSSGSILSAGATAGVGYRTGAGGTVTQATSKSTGVTLNKVSGQITMNNATLNAGAEVGFTLTNSAIAATDVVVVSIASGATADSYLVGVDAVGAGSCRIALTNVSASNLGEALVLNFAVIKAVAA